MAGMRNSVGRVPVQLGRSRPTSRVAVPAHSLISLKAVASAHFDVEPQPTKMEIVGTG